MPGSLCNGVRSRARTIRLVIWHRTSCPQPYSGSVRNCSSNASANVSPVCS